MSNSTNTDVLERRLELGAHGPRASLTRCAVRFRSFLDAIHAPSSTRTAEAIEESKLLLEHELSLYKVEFTKLVRQVQAVREDRRRLHQLSKELQTLLDEQTHHVEVSLRNELLQRQRTVGYKHEYEALAKVASHRSSRRILDKRLQLLTKQIAITEHQHSSLQRELSLRQVQFQTLVQYMHDLTTTVTLPLVGDNDDDDDGDNNNDDDDDNDKKKGTTRQEQDDGGGRSRGGNNNNDNDNDDDDDDEVEDGIVEMDCS